TMSALAVLIAFVARGGARWIKGREVAFAIIPLGFAYIAFGHWYLSKYQWPRVKLQNPVISFAASIVRARNAPRLLTMHTDIGPDDFLIAAERKSRAATTAPSAPP